MTQILDREIARKIQQVARALAAKTEAALRLFGLTSAERGVLEMLCLDKATTVPQIARRLSVSRQHIQVTVNALVEKGLIILSDNPDHARSALLSLTEKGVTTFAAIQMREMEINDQMFATTPAAEKVIMSRVLGQLIQKLN